MFKIILAAKIREKPVRGESLKMIEPGYDI